MDFVCPHCNAGALRIIDVAEDSVWVECILCAKVSTIERRTDPPPAVKPPAHGLTR